MTSQLGRLCPACVEWEMSFEVTKNIETGNNTHLPNTPIIYGSQQRNWEMSKSATHQVACDPKNSSSESRMEMDSIQDSSESEIGIQFTQDEVAHPSEVCLLRNLFKWTPGQTAPEKLQVVQPLGF